MERSEHGQKLVYLSDLITDIDLKNVNIDVVDSNFDGDVWDEIIETVWGIIESEDKKKPENEKNAYDAVKWRYEGISIDEEKKTLNIAVSKSKYSCHRAIRDFLNVLDSDKPNNDVEKRIRLAAENLMYINGYKKEDLLSKLESISDYPNPFSINTLQKTLDGYLMLAERGGGSDQPGMVAVVGAGFVESDGDSPESLCSTVMRVCDKESKSNGEEFSYSLAMPGRIISGSNNDTTCYIYIERDKTASEIRFNEKDYQFKKILFVRADPETIKNVIASGEINGARLADHTIGCLESYLMQNSYIPADMSKPELYVLERGSEKLEIKKIKYDNKNQLL